MNDVLIPILGPKYFAANDIIPRNHKKNDESEDENDEYQVNTGCPQKTTPCLNRYQQHEYLIKIFMMVTGRIFKGVRGMWGKRQGLPSVVIAPNKKAKMQEIRRWGKRSGSIADSFKAAVDDKNLRGMWGKH